MNSPDPETPTMARSRKPDVDEVEGIDLDFTPRDYFRSRERGESLPPW